MEDLSRDDKVRVVFILLKQLQPFLSAQNLSAMNPAHMGGPARSVGNPMMRQSVGTVGSSIDGMNNAYTSNRSANMKGAMQNNYVNRSL